MYRNALLTACALALAGLAGCASRPDEQTLYYQCRSGQHIDVTYRGEGTAIVQMGARPLVMQRAESPVGRRYVGSDLQWLIQTRHDIPLGTLYTRGRDGGLGEIAERCRQTGED